MGNAAVEVDDLSKRFRLYQRKYTSLKERVVHGGKSPHEDFWALRDIDLKVAEGETIGILGRNGSGKSTLLKCICGVLQPTTGRVVIRGTLAGLLELGAGFQAELSGRDNIYLNGSLLGLSRRDIDKRFDEIVAFAELEQFIDNQVKFYSSGMYVRLGFAVAVSVEPDVLVIDEVLAVGDERFQRKCLERVKLFQKEGRTIIFVTHAPDMVRAICDRAVVLQAGRMIGLGTPGEAIRNFREHLLDVADALPGATGTASEGDVADEELLGAGAGGAPAPGEAGGGGLGSTIVFSDAGVPSVEPAPAPKADGHLWKLSDAETATSNRKVLITQVALEYPEMTERAYLLPNEPLTVQADLRAIEEMEEIAVTIEMFDIEGNLLFASDTEIAETGDSWKNGLIPAGASRVVLHFWTIPMLDGAYDISIGVQSREGGVVYDWREQVCRFEVMNPGRSRGLVALPLFADLLTDF